MMQNRLALPLAMVAVVISFSVGCQAPLSAPEQGSALSASSAPMLEPSKVNRTTLPSSVDPALLAAAEETPTAESTEAAMAKILSDLETLGAIKPGEKRQLQEDLRNAKRENWPLIVQQFRSALAYRQQLAEREAADDAEASLVSDRPSGYQPRRYSRAGSKQAVATDSTLKRIPAVEESEDTAVVISDEMPEEQPIASVQAIEKARPLPKPAAPREQLVTTPAAQKQHVIKQVSYEAPVQMPETGWEEDLQTSISKLEKNVKSNPSSVEEVHDHMRLRLLRLLAGEEEASLAPIPGASSLQQDYWAKQLFAVSTFLDSERQPDDKRRAAGSLIQLDQARAKLSELATLQVRNLTFVDSVEGFGVYEPREKTEFRPGDQVTLYTEVDNFRSESTKEGYRTVLGTSYEVVDDRGQRVDSAQFPDVEDVCRNHRHDFHMQYGVALPTRIYAGEYQIKITITDHLSHKISQASVPFTIVE